MAAILLVGGVESIWCYDRDIWKFGGIARAQTWQHDYTWTSFWLGSVGHGTTSRTTARARVARPTRMWRKSMIAIYPPSEIVAVRDAGVVPWMTGGQSSTGSSPPRPFVKDREVGMGSVHVMSRGRRDAWSLPVARRGRPFWKHPDEHSTIYHDDAK
ncbi:hypothetical protein CPLU01_06772 [Colletotrichum plurivorum]|uniref:Uncharacterized protein n=1 Tax=Colletotrichum plurivorum TaxID=2175906 RepID=A0A8H6KI19_9PEZI|nr:hypothetical protein CPLU01_06772 [Colletotrichum plurivorum]